MAIIGEVCELDAASVPDSAIELLWHRMDEKQDVFPFNCCLCGAERKAKLIDPGTLLIRDFKCADVMQRCQKPLRPKSRRKPVFLIPGSLVACQMVKDDPTPWPGIIEDCPYGTDVYMIPGKTSDTVKAYFVTLILPKSYDRRWVGGYIAAKNLFPYQMKRPPPDSTVTYSKSLKIANAALHHAVNRRLVDLSFVAHAASRRRICLKPHTSMVGSSATQKRAASPIQNTRGEETSDKLSAQPKKMRESSPDESSSSLADNKQKPSRNTYGARPKRWYITSRVLILREQSPE